MEFVFNDNIIKTRGLLSVRSIFCSLFCRRRYTHGQAHTYRITILYFSFDHLPFRLVFLISSRQCRICRNLSQSTPNLAYQTRNLPHRARPWLLLLWWRRIGKWFRQSNSCLISLILVLEKMPFSISPRFVVSFSFHLRKVTIWLVYL